MAPRSTVWLHFEKVTNEKGEHKAKCKYCERLLASHPKDNGTSSLRSHYNSCLARIALESKQSELVFTAGNEEWDKGLGCWKFDQESIRKCLSFMIIVDELSFKFVENEGFKHLMAVACPRFHVPSRHTIARDCFEQYSIERKKLKQYFKNTSQRVCLTTDTWTSLQKVNYMCLTAHFIDENWKLHKKILNFCPITDHRGEIIGRAVENCLLDWGIDRVFTITVDNASSNDVAIEFLKKKISNWGTSVVGCKYLHMRCIAHIINLVVVDGLKEMHDSMARVQAAVKFVKQFPARYANFKKCIEREKIESKALLCLDVSTRWNSTYLMLNAVQKFERAFETYATDDPHFEHELNELTGGILTSDDWENVRRLFTFFENFYDLTCRISGSLYVTSNTFFHEISEVDGLLYEWGTSDDLEFAFMARKMKEKYEKYWGNVEKMNMLIYVAVILDPQHKLKYVEFALNEMYQSKKDLGIKLAQKAKDALNELFSWYEKTLQP